MKWTEERVRELNNLEMLLREVSGINSSDELCWSIKLCTRVADELGGYPHEEGRMSFLDFLRGLSFEIFDHERSQHIS